MAGRVRIALPAVVAAIAVLSFLAAVAQADDVAPLYYFATDSYYDSVTCDGAPAYQIFSFVQSSRCTQTAAACSNTTSFPYAASARVCTTAAATPSALPYVVKRTGFLATPCAASATVEFYRDNACIKVGASSFSYTCAQGNGTVQYTQYAENDTTCSGEDVGGQLASTASAIYTSGFCYSNAAQFTCSDGRTPLTFQMPFKPDNTVDVTPNGGVPSAGARVRARGAVAWSAALAGLVAGLSVL